MNTEWKEHQAVIEVKNTLKPLKKGNKDDYKWIKEQAERTVLREKLIYRGLPYKEGEVKNVTIAFYAKPTLKITKQIIQSLLDSKANSLYLFEEKVIKDAQYFNGNSEAGISQFTVIDCVRCKVIAIKN
jgi:hypothetical protein